MNPSQRMNKKEVAAAAGVSVRTMNRRKHEYAWLARCRAPGTGRPTFNRRCVAEEMRKRRMA